MKERRLLTNICLVVAIQLFLSHAANAQISGCYLSDLALVVPASQSSSEWTELKAFLVAVLGNLDVGGTTNTFQIAIVKYGGSAQVEFQLNAHSDKAGIITAVNQMPQISATGDDVADAEGLLTTKIFIPGNGERLQGVQTSAIVFFDSQSNNVQDTYAAAVTLENSGVYVMTFGLTLQVDSTEINSVATPETSPGVSNVFTVSGYDQLSSQVQAFSSFLCTYRKPICAKQADIVLILDQSTSIVAAPGSYNNWYISILGFAQNIIESFPVGADLTRFGIVRFSDVAHIDIWLNGYTNETALLYAVSLLPIGGGETNIADAFLKAGMVLFNDSAGARDGVKKIIFLITDGKANRDADQTLIQANLTKVEGVEVFCVGITNQIDVNQLESIASLPSDTHFYYSSNYSLLDAVVLPKLLTETCLSVQTTTTMTPSTMSPTATTTTPTTTTTTPTTTTTTPTTTTTTPTTTTTTPTTTTTTPTTTTTTPTTTTTTPTTTTTTPTTTTTTPTTTTTTPTTTTTTPTTTTTTPTTTTTTPTTTTTTPTTTTTTPTTTTTTPTTTMTPEHNPLPSCLNAADVVFVVDSSGNLDWFHFDQLLAFVEGVAELFSIDAGLTQVGMIVYSNAPQLVFNLNTYKQSLDVTAAVAAASLIGDTTNIAAALSYLCTDMFTGQNGGRATVPHVGVVVTTARSDNPVASQQQADLCRRAGITLIVVAVGNWLDTDEAWIISSFPAVNTLIFVSYANLSYVGQRIADPVCRNINYCDNTCSNGACDNSIGVGQCVCKPGFGGADCDQVCSHAADVIFAMDSSGSIGLNNWILLVNFLMDVVEGFDLDSAMASPNSNTGVRVGLLTFTNTTYPIFNLDTYTSKVALLQGLNTRYRGGTTDMAAAIQEVTTSMFTGANGDRPGVPNILVLMTDGVADNMTASWEASIAARNKGITILAVGVGDYTNFNELQALVSAPATSNILMTTNFTTLTLDNLAGQLDALICQNVDACVPNPCKNGATCHSIIGGFSCSPCPLGFTGQYCERDCSGVIDLVIIFDVSGSIELERFPIIKDSIANLMLSFDVTFNRTRVGLIYFSDYAFPGFYLDSYNEQQDVQQAIRNVPFLAGKTNTAAALQLLHTTMYLDENGGRSGVKRISVVITDGDADVNVLQTIPQAVQAHVAGIEIIAVAVGQAAFVDGSMIQAIASLPDSWNVLNISSYYAFPNITNSLIRATCNEFNDCNSNPCLNNATCIDDYGMYECDCPYSYAGVNCDKTCTGEADIVFILDLSGSVEEIGYYNPIITLVTQICYGLDVADDIQRVGVVTYSTQVNDQFYLKDYARNQMGLIDALNFNNNGGHTNTQAAIADAQNVQFTEANGNRPAVPKIAIIISDGASDIPEESSPSADAAANLKASGVTVYAIAIGDSPNLEELGNLVSSENNLEVLPSFSADDIATMSTTMIDILCQG